MSTSKVCNIVCAVLMALLIVLQCAPFWHYGDPEQATSIQGYVWFPSDNSALEKHIQAETDNASFTVGNIVLMPALEFILCAVGVFFCLIKSGSPYTGILPSFAGALGVWGYLAGGAAFRLGSTYALHLIVCIALLAAGLIAAIDGIKNRA